MLGRLLAFLSCFMFEHLAEQDNMDHYVSTCGRCDEDVRPVWMIQMENEDRLEAMALKLIERNRGRLS